MMKVVIATILLFMSVTILAQGTIPLYTGEIPNSIPNHMKEVVTFNKDGSFKGYRGVSVPTLTIFLPGKEMATGAAVIICPGGGYISETYTGEGTIIAKAFNEKGIAAFVLKYRLPSDSIMIDKTTGPLQDAQQAIKIVRQRAAEWAIDTGRIGIMGFSAGGHLASTAGTHFNKAYIPDPEKINLRPDFLILAYPVISMTDSIAHKGSRTNLLGKNPTDEMKMEFSNELHVTRNTPPTWLTHAGDDTSVPVENSIRFYQALIHNKVPAEMHLYPKGNHAFILKLKPEDWMIPLFEWMRESGFCN